MKLNCTPLRIVCMSACTVLSALSACNDRRANTTNFNTTNLKYVNGNQRTDHVLTRVGGGELSIRTFASAVPQCDHGRAEPDYEAELAGTKGVLPPTRGMSGDNLYGPRPDLWWTGPAPASVPAPAGPGSSLPQLRLNSPTARKDLLNYFDNTWFITEGEDSFKRPPPHNLRHPLIFYYGHPAALYVNKLRVAGLLPGPIDARFERLFETGVDEMSWDDLSIGGQQWPSVASVHAYRAEVYRKVKDVILSASDSDLRNITQDSPYWALPMSMEHERIHIETSSVLLREMPLHEGVTAPTQFWPPHYHNKAARGSAPTYTPQPGVHFPTPEYITMEGGEVILGKPREYPSYGWDNEYGQRTYDVKPFAAGKYMVTNGEFHEFVSQGGYSTRDLWTDDGWAWKAFKNAKWPAFWAPCGPSGLHQYKLRCVFEEAFSMWKARKEGRPFRITTELEQQLIRGKEDATDSVMEGSGDMMSQHGCNLNLSIGSETPVDLLPPNRLGFHDAMGNAWEWCEDHFSALEGFNVNRLYEDFSTPCFDGKHNVIMGGSWASTGNEASRFARFHFRPHFQQHAGFRLVQVTDPSHAEDGVYMTSCTDAPPPYVGETYPFRRSDRTADDAARASRSPTETALAAHYPVVGEALAASSTFVPGFEQILSSAFSFNTTLADMAAPFAPLAIGRALDVGCGPGGVTFALARRFASVTGAEISAEQLSCARQLQQQGSLVYGQQQAGDMMGFDAVLIHACLDRLASPASLLGRMGGPCGVVKPGGIVLIASSYEWADRYTPSAARLNTQASADASAAQRACDSLGQALAGGGGAGFELVCERELPRARMHSDSSSGRTCELTMVHVTVWRRRDEH
ncbi:hypothetical protein JKP88DRAFT_267490 [Tribonema minus]|uniref:Generic methyltransferase n=1 Tax=Tribonema minus TaxID=303371 RepID=A0A835ZH27_9STRA|nr:hypothetical protein JKP88DRAFT_267490 [Tribonema minus]